jgi:hypothetical protein
MGFSWDLIGFEQDFMGLNRDSIGVNDSWGFNQQSMTK